LEAQGQSVGQGKFETAGKNWERKVGGRVKIPHQLPQGSRGWSISFTDEPQLF